jgi:predicted aspartyl protease
VPVKAGQIIKGHPHVDVLVSPDGIAGSKFSALIDTGFSGFLSVPVITASLLGLKTHATARYTLANGKLSDPIPLAYGYACLEGDQFVQGLISLSEHTSTVVGVDFLFRCGKALLLSSRGVVILSEAEIVGAMGNDRPYRS